LSTRTASEKFFFRLCVDSVFTASSRKENVSPKYMASYLLQSGETFGFRRHVVKVSIFWDIPQRHWVIFTDVSGGYVRKRQ
jgi:hypothetical protein